MCLKVSDPQPALVLSVLCGLGVSWSLLTCTQSLGKHIKTDRETDHDETHCGVGPVAVQLPRLVHLRWCRLDYRRMSQPGNISCSLASSRPEECGGGVCVRSPLAEWGAAIAWTTCMGNGQVESGGGKVRWCWLSWQASPVILWQRFRFNDLSGMPLSDSTSPMGVRGRCMCEVTTG